MPDRVQIVGRPRHDVARAVLLEEAGRLGFEVREEVVAEVELDLARGSDDDLARDVEKGAGNGSDAEQLQAGARDDGSAEVKAKVVDRAANDDRDQCLADVIDNERDTAPGKAPPVALEVREERAKTIEHGLPCCVVTVSFLDAEGARGTQHREARIGCPDGAK